jgi:hypothetical protein
LSKLVVKNQIDKWKVEGQECTRLIKLMTQFWLIKDQFDENIFIWGKKNTNLDEKRTQWEF